MKHSDAANLCRLEASRLGGMLLPMTNGLFWPVENGKPAANGRPVRIGRAGAADLIGTINGRAVACEVKVGKDVQRPEQEKFQAAWEEAGGVYVISRDGDVSVLDFVGKCRIRQWADETGCIECGLRWDTNDSAPPECRNAK